MLTLGAWYVNALAASFLLVSIFMMLVILIQKPKGGGCPGPLGVLGVVRLRPRSGLRPVMC